MTEHCWESKPKRYKELDLQNFKQTFLLSALENRILDVTKRTVSKILYMFNTIENRILNVTKRYDSASTMVIES